MFTPPPIIRIDNQLLCNTHQNNVEYFRHDRSPFTPHIRLSCPLCRPPLGEKVETQAYQSVGAFTLTLKVTKPSEDENLKSNPPLDFLNHKLEHIIRDNFSVGLAPRNLIYIKDQSLLAACSFNGRVVLWKIGDTVKYVHHFEINKTIRCTKYIKVSEEKKYLLIGADTEIFVYNINDGKVDLVKTLENTVLINDLEHMPDQNKFLTASEDAFIRAWSLETLEQDGLIELGLYGIKEKTVSIIYLQEKKSFALEYEKGFYLISIGNESGDKILEEPKKFEIAGRSMYGLAYLPQHSQFILRSSVSNSEVIDANTLLCIQTLRSSARSVLAPGFRYSANQDESQIIVNGNSSVFLVADHTVHEFRLNGLVGKVVAVEVLHDQYRFVVGDEQTGNILVFRTNIVDTTPVTQPFSFGGDLAFNNQSNLSSFRVSPFQNQTPIISNSIFSNVGSQRPIPTSVFQPKPSFQPAIVPTKPNFQFTPLLAPRTGAVARQTGSLSSRRGTSTSKLYSTMEIEQKRIPKSRSRSSRNNQVKPTKKREAQSPTSKKTTKKVTQEKPKKKKVEKGELIEVKLDTSGSKKRTKSEDGDKFVFVMLPKRREKERNRSDKKELSREKKKEKKPQKTKKQAREESVAREKGKREGRKTKEQSEERSRSRSKSKSNDRPKSIDETIKKAKQSIKHMQKTMVTKRRGKS